MPLAFPPRHILVPVDFSEPSRSALRFGARLALHCDAALHVLHAEDPLLAAAARASGIDLRAQTIEELTRFIESSALPPLTRGGDLGGSTPVVHVVGGAARQVICDIATREGADAIVVGARGMSGTEHFVFGSTTEGVLRLADVPVIVVPHAWSSPTPGSTDLTGVGPVIGAVDFGEPSIDAAAAAARFARLLHCPLELVHVVPPLPVIDRWTSHAEASVSERVQQAQEQLADLAQRVSEGAAFEVRVDVGPIPQRLAEAARVRDDRHPILFLGRRRPDERGAAPGATAYRVLTLAQVPVVMYVRG